MVVSLSQQNQLWNRILSNVKERVEDKHIYDSFFANTKLHKVEGDIMYIDSSPGLGQRLRLWEAEQY